VHNGACAALLLAGGASRRMGSPKALLDFGGRPLWLRQMEKLQALAPRELFISTPRGLALGEGPWTIVHDERPGLGPLAGLSAARAAMSSEWLVVLAVDLPAMTSGYLESLRAAAVAAGKGQVPELDGFYAGLAAVYPRACLDLARDHLESEDRSVQRFVRAGIDAGFLAVRPVAEKERPFFRNLNEPADYAAARAAHPSSFPGNRVA
jgi:molybdopterin-guanine dinucleotide biosynthesis protein A